ncbi:replication protein, partial [bacterium]|nr:replication protein [bacterium]
MADVQTEKGHIRIANNLYRAITLAKVTPIQRRALLECIWRQYGWAKRGAKVQPFPLGGTDLAKSIGCSRPTASTAVSGLVEMRVLLKTTSGRFLLEKDFDRWRCGFSGDPDRVHWTAANGYLDPSEVLANDDAQRNEMLTQASSNDNAERNEMLTPPMPQRPLLVDSSGSLEPREPSTTKEIPPISPTGGPVKERQDDKPKPKRKRKRKTRAAAGGGDEQTPR